MGSTSGSTPAAVGRLVRRVCDACPLPIIAKLTPNVTDIVPIAAAAAEAGADAVSLINTIRGMAVDWRRRRPILAYDVGGLSGPAIKPIALRMVWDVARALPGLPIIGIGGIATCRRCSRVLGRGRIGRPGRHRHVLRSHRVGADARRSDSLGSKRPAVTEMHQIIGTLRVESELDAFTPDERRLAWTRYQITLRDRPVRP